jgi:hypothetical protein
MAVRRPFLRCAGAFALCAAVWLLALQLLAAGGLGVGAAAGAAAAGHSLCLAAPDRDGAPAYPGPGGDCGSCLFCQQRGAAFSGLAVEPFASMPIVPRAEGAAGALLVAPAQPPERRAGRGGRSSRAPPAFG